MNLERFQTWLNNYGRAWESRDPQAAANLFAEDGMYQVTPFEEPLRGRAAIYEYWTSVTQSQQDIHFRNEILAVTEYLGVVRWQTSFVRIPSGVQVQLDGIFVVALDAENSCTVFKEWWHRREKAKDAG